MLKVNHASLEIEWNDGSIPKLNLLLTTMSGCHSINLGAILSKLEVRQQGVISSRIMDSLMND